MGTPISGASLDQGGETQAAHGCMATLSSATSVIAGIFTREGRKARTATVIGGMRRPPRSDDETVSGQALTAQNPTHGSDPGQVSPAETAHEVSPDTVEMACLRTAGWVRVGPGDTVSHTKSWRWAIVESVAVGAGGQGLVTVRFGRGDCLTGEAALFMADRASEYDKEPADKHREGDTARAAPAGVRVAGSEQENTDEREALEAGRPGRREVEETRRTRRR